MASSQTDTTTASGNVESAEQLCAEWKRCGGCPLLDLSRQAQRRHHEQRVREKLTEAGVHVGDLRWIAGPSRLGYRNRIRLRLDGGVPLFFNRDKPSSCAVLSEGVHAALEEFREFAVDHRLWLRQFDHAELWEPDLDGVACAALYRSGREPRVPGAESLRPTSSKALSLWVADGDAPLARRVRLPMDLDGFVAPASFHQVNTEANALLGAAITREAMRLQLTSFAEVYCGSGNFALPLMAAGLSGRGVEQNPLPSKTCTERRAPFR